MYLANRNLQKNDGIEFTTQSLVNEFTKHSLPTDPNRDKPFNLDKLRSRDGLLGDLDENSNLLFKGENWAVATTIGPYGNHHLMLIYTGISQDISHLGQVPQNQMQEYYDILGKLLNGLEESYKDRIESGELSLIYGLNCSLVPGQGKSQSVFRPHTHIILIHNNEKDEEFHKIEKLFINDSEKNNKGELALNKQNLAMIKNFEQSFLDLNFKKYKQSIFVTEDDFYAIDIPVNGNLGDTETIKTFEKLHSEGREFLEAIQRRDTRLINQEVFDVLGEEIHKIGFSLGFYKENGISHLRFRFSFKNPGENAGVLETMLRAIKRDEKLGRVLPDMSEIKGHVGNILTNKK